MPTPEDVIQAATEFAETIPDYTALTTPACLAQCWMHFQRVTKVATILAAGDGWLPIASAPKDGSEVWVYAPAAHGLSSIQCRCAWHPDAGWCVDELREVTHWRSLPPPPEIK